MKTKQVKKGVLHLGYFFLVCKIANAKHVSCMLLNKEEPTYFALGYFTLFMFYTECSRIIVIATMSLQKKKHAKKNMVFGSFTESWLFYCHLLHFSESCRSYIEFPRFVLLIGIFITTIIIIIFLY